MDSGTPQEHLNEIKTLDDIGLARVPYFKRKNLPERPGLYFLLNGDEILYIGYSSNLRRRWNSRRRLMETVDPKYLEIGYILLSEDEGLLQEVKYIKQFNPPFNFASIKEPKGIIIRARITQQENQNLLSACKAADMNISDFVREAISYYTNHILFEKWQSFFRKTDG